MHRNLDSNACITVVLGLRHVIGHAASQIFRHGPFTVRCWPGDQQHSGKGDDFPIVECGIGERDVAAAMVSDGEAFPIEGYSHRYDGLSKEADNAGIGIQGGDMIPPSEWRSGKRLDGESGRCLFATVVNGHYVSTWTPL